HALEIRVPLIDHKLVEYMFTVPGRLKIDSRGINKPLLVNSLPRKLPDRVVHRKKMGFTLPFDTWMRTKLKNELENVLLTPQSPLQGIISETAVEQLWRDFLRNRISWSRPWSLFILKNWVERNIN
ncbi:MAG: asparagine synthase-related protein, partial [Nitrospinales bacterium]